MDKYTVKLPFDIKFRKQIEDGTYKLVTCCGEPVKIISWDRKHSTYPIVALKTLEKYDSILEYSIDGTSPIPSDDLYILRTDDVPSEFDVYLKKFAEHVSSKTPTEDDLARDIEEWKDRLLAVAKDESKRQIKRELEEEPNGWVDRVTEAYNSGFSAGMRKAYKDTPHWHYADYTMLPPSVIYRDGEVKVNTQYFVEEKDVYYIPLQELSKLPTDKI